MAAIDLNLLAFGLLLAGFGVLPAVMALRAEYRRDARHAARMAQIDAILSGGGGLSPR